MKNPEIKIKLSYITGLRPVVLDELEKNPGFHIAGEEDDSILIQFTSGALMKAKELRSVARAYLVLQDGRYNPAYVSNHKSILGDIIDLIFEAGENDFRSFKISCAGSDSSEARAIARYVQETYSLVEKEEADLKIHLIKSGDVWEIGAQITPRPLSVRDYRAVNMSGAMDPTIAYAANSMCELEKAGSYLNVFSGSGTLLIEAGQCHQNLDRLVGFDNDKKRISLSVQNIKKAGLIKKIEVKEADIFDKPDFGKFDAIVSDLPFGMSISKDEDLDELYRAFIEYCEDALDPGGRLIAYTSEHEILEPIIARSRFRIVKTLDLKFMTSVNAYLRPKIIVCEFGNKTK